MPHLLLFDLDDTLCDYASARDQRLRRAFHSALHAEHPDHGIDMDQLVTDSVATHPHGADHFGELLQARGIRDAAVAHAAASWYRTNRFHGLELFTDAVPVLDLLRATLPQPHGRIGVITNGPAEVQRAKIELLQVARHVDFIIISGEFGVWKPDPAIFAEALRLGEAEAKEAVFIGDSVEHDMAGARSAGIRSIWVNRADRPWTDAAPPPDHQIQALSDLPRLLGLDSGLKR
jgi:putative hydrolase of the HAD superfamily